MKGIKPRHKENSEITNLAKGILFDDFQQKMLNCLPENEADYRSRKNIIHFLEVLAANLDPILSLKQNTQENDAQYVLEHPTVALLIDLADMFRDLENGKTPELMKPNPHGATASLSFAERREYEVLQTALKIVQIAFDGTTASAASELVAKKLKKAGWKRKNGDFYTSEFLRKLQYRSRKQNLIKRIRT